MGEEEDLGLVEVNRDVSEGCDGEDGEAPPWGAHLPVVHDEGGQVARDERVHPPAGPRQEHPRLQDARP